MHLKYKYCIYFLFCVIINCVNAQSNQTKKQIKTDISIDYKLPLLMKPFKKSFPKKGALYISSIGSRLESTLKLLGNNINTVLIENYEKGYLIEYVQITKKDTIEEHINFSELKPDTNTTIYIGEKIKNIMGYRCKDFIVQTDTTEIKGFLTEELIGTGLLIKGKDYGFPLEYTETYKKSKIIKSISVKTETVTKEFFDSTKFLLNK